MYVLPRPYKCPQCGHECQFSPQCGHGAPVLNDGPICPKCWGEFVLSVAPVMKRVPRKRGAMKNSPSIVEVPWP